MTFTDPILGGESTLIRDAIRSPNYVPGVSGWSINRDGTFELNGGIFRGDVIVTDPDGSMVAILAGDGGRIRYYPPTEPGVTVLDPGQSYSSYSGTAGNGYAFMTIITPEVEVAGNSYQPGSLLLAGELTDGSAFPGMDNPATYAAWNGDFAVSGQLTVGDRLNNSTDGMTYRRGQVGVQNVAMGASATTFSQAVVFPIAFPVGVTPSVAGLNIRTSAAAGQLWCLRATSITNTGFTILGSRTAAAQLSSDIDWQAFV